MPGGATPVTNKITLYSIQTVYNLYLERVNSSKLFNIHCKNVIEIPIAEPVSRVVDVTTYTVIPATAIVIDSVSLSDLKIVIETNEGVTVEPTVVEKPYVAYKKVYLLCMPRGTTGIKKVSIRAVDAFGPSILNDLIFGVMDAPYNYENHLSTIINNKITQLATLTQNQYNALDSKITSLENRVTALENKAGT